MERHNWAITPSQQQFFMARTCEALLKDIRRWIKDTKAYVEHIDVRSVEVGGRWRHEATVHHAGHNTQGPNYGVVD